MGSGLTRAAQAAARSRWDGKLTDDQLWALAEALDSWAVGQVQGFHYGSRFVVRDCMRRPDNQVVWEGPDTDRPAFERQCEIERMRAAVGLWLTSEAMMQHGRDALGKGEG